MNNIRILYLTKGLGKYQILSLVRVKITSPWGLKGHKNTFPCGLRPLGKVFLTFWPLGEVIFDPHAGEYFILTRPLGEVYHILPLLFISKVLTYENTPTRRSMILKNWKFLKLTEIFILQLPLEYENTPTRGSMISKNFVKLTFYTPTVAQCSQNFQNRNLRDIYSKIQNIFILFRRAFSKLKMSNHEDFSNTNSKFFLERFRNLGLFLFYSRNSP